MCLCCCFGACRSAGMDIWTVELDSMMMFGRGVALFCILTKLYLVCMCW